ncbi:MAG: hypothetical protein M5U28_28035 [Sandaracinaceae bacterium]|nr:hypothetical protein [Sandaracinaceae bacterium]
MIDCVNRTTWPVWFTMRMRNAGSGVIAPEAVPVARPERIVKLRTISG